MGDYLKSIIIVFLFFYGCAPIPKTERAVVFDSTDCEKMVQEALRTDVFVEGDWPKEEWWEDFENPQLTTLIEEALLISPTLKRVEERFKAAHQLALQKRARLFPEMDFDADSDWQHLSKTGFFRSFAATVPAVVNDITAGLNFTYEFDFWGKNRNRYKAALNDASASAAEALQAKLILTTSIAYAFVELQFLNAKLQLLKQLEENELAITSIRIGRQESGIDMSTDHLQARSDRLDRSAMVVEISRAIQEKIHQIKALAGLSQNVSFYLPDPKIMPKSFVLPQNLSLDLIARRPDLIAERWRLEAAAKEIKVAKADFFPNVNLVAMLGFESIHLHTLFQKQSYSGEFDPAIHLPLFTAGRLQAQYREKVADYNEAVYTYNELILRVSQEIADRLSGIFFLQKELDVRAFSLDTAKEIDQVTQRRFQNAIEDKIALINAQNNVIDIQLIFTELLYMKQLLWIQLIRSLGGGLYE